MVIEEEDSLKDYYDLLQQYKSLKKDVHDIVFSPKYCLPFLQPGRLVRILYPSDDNAPCFSPEDQTTWGVIINFERVKGQGEGKNVVEVCLGYLYSVGIFALVSPKIPIFVLTLLKRKACT